MKKTIAVSMLLLTLTLGMASAQNMATTAAADTAQTDEIEAYSDTTQADTSATQAVTYTHADDDFDSDDPDALFNVIAKNVDADDLMGMGFALMALLIIFVLAPLVIIGVVMYFIFKNRKERMRLAEMAMRNGQPIPSDLMYKEKNVDDDLYAKGVRQAFLGVGLVFFLGWWIGRLGTGIGLLVLCIGLGNLFIARRDKQRRDSMEADGPDQTFNTPTGNDKTQP